MVVTICGWYDYLRIEVKNLQKNDGNSKIPENKINHNVKKLITFYNSKKEMEGAEHLRIVIKSIRYLEHAP